MNGVEKRLARLRRLRTELQDLGLEDAAEEVEDEISGLETMATDNPTVAEYAGAAMELEESLNKAMRRGGN